VPRVQRRRLTKKRFNALYGAVCPDRSPRSLLNVLSARPVLSRGNDDKLKGDASIYGTICLDHSSRPNVDHVFWDGLNLISQSLAIHEMAAHGVPAILIPLMIRAAQALQLVASLGLIFGIYPRLAALALILFLIPATLMAHGLLAGCRHTAVHDSGDQLLQEHVYGWGTSFLAATKDQPVRLPRSTR
jgi:putative oxidoreductase